MPHNSWSFNEQIVQDLREFAREESAIEESQRPGLVVFVIVTDGQENSSREFTREKIREMIEHQQSVYKWHFTFLAANQDAFAEGASMGIAQAGTAGYTRGKMKNAWGATAKKMSRMRKAVREGAAVDNNFTEEERKEML